MQDSFNLTHNIPIICHQRRSSMVLRMQVIECQEWQTCYKNTHYVCTRRTTHNYFGKTLITGKSNPLSNYELEGMF